MSLTNIRDRLQRLKKDTGPARSKTPQYHGVCDQQNDTLCSPEEVTTPVYEGYIFA